MIQRIFLIALAGALGTLSRYGLSKAIQRLCGTAFPWGTFAANVFGCFLFGLIWSLADADVLISTESKAIILTGFMGAFTTFSTFIFDSGKMLLDVRWFSATANILGQVCTGIAFLFVGLTLGKM